MVSIKFTDDTNGKKGGLETQTGKILDRGLKRKITTIKRNDGEVFMTS